MEKKKVLIVEDEIFIARDLQMSLERMGYIVNSIVQTGERAIQKIKDEDIDIIMMDIVLQGEMDGIETAEIIYTDFDIPVIYLTAYGEEHLFERAIKTEPFGYITKPFEKENIKKAIEVALYKHGAEKERKILIQKLRMEVENRKRTEIQINGINNLKEFLLGHGSFEEKLKRITNDVVKIFNADFCRIWIIKPGDLCETGCIHAEATEGPHMCRYRGRCLYLMASSGRYTHIDGDHRRVPFGCYKIGLVASGIDSKFLTNDVTSEQRIHDHDWARNLGLVSFVGYRFLSSDGNPIGVLALFSKQMISPDEDILIESIANTASQVIQTEGAEKELRKRTEQIINHQKVLLGLSKQGFSDLESALKRITEIDSKTMEVERVSVWFFNKDYSEISCKCLYNRSKDLHLHEEDLTLRANDCPGYFKALNLCRILVANDACNDPLTSEFTEGYLKPHGITSMLDVPVRLHGKMIGTVCHEHTGPMREWTSEEQEFAASVSDMVSLAMESNERQKMEEMLLRSEKLKAMGVITSGVAHEFNNILAIILGNVQLIEIEYKDHKQLTDALHIIKRATNDGAEISKKMLKFTKIKEDTIGFVSCDIRDLINHAIDFTMPRWKNMAQAKGVNYRIERKGISNVPSILCNPTELREVFINLINNALDAMPDGGIITVATRRVRSEEFGVESRKENASELRTQNSKLKGDFVEITFADNGEGMSEEVKKSIFDPFFTTKLPVGSGLGMSTVYGIITRHGGKIEVESEIGKGTIFTLQFPITLKTSTLDETCKQKKETKTKGFRVLVVDDEEEICYILKKYFSIDGHKVKIVNNGADAIKLSKGDSFDLVLCDLVMPDVSGYDVIKALNTLDKRPKIGIITGRVEKLKFLEGKNMQVDFIVKKPFDFSELTRQISELGIKEL